MYRRGLNLYDFADYLIAHHGMYNGINLDGGGSASADKNGVVVNYPSDFCDTKQEWRCPRAVSSILCIHEPSCQAPCENDSKCISGSCQCLTGWSGSRCELAWCNNKCRNGQCTQLGSEAFCSCEPGWSGKYCSVPCSSSQFGSNCKNSCDCGNIPCDSISGLCFEPNILNITVDFKITNQPVTFAFNFLIYYFTIFLITFQFIHLCGLLY